MKIIKRNIYDLFFYFGIFLMGFGLVTIGSKFAIPNIILGSTIVLMVTLIWAKDRIIKEIKKEVDN